MTNGLMTGEQKVSVVLVCFICDAPARAFVKNIKQYTGYSACEKCNLTGRHYENRVIFTGTGGEVERSDASFRRQEDEEHHRGDSTITPSN